MTDQPEKPDDKVRMVMRPRQAGKSAFGAFDLWRQKMMGTAPQMLPTPKVQFWQDELTSQEQAQTAVGPPPQWENKLANVANRPSTWESLANMQPSGAQFAGEPWNAMTTEAKAKALRDLDNQNLSAPGLLGELASAKIESQQSKLEEAARVASVLADHDIQMISNALRFELQVKIYDEVFALDWLVPQTDDQLRQIAEVLKVKRGERVTLEQEATALRAVRECDPTAEVVSDSGHILAWNRMLTVPEVLGHIERDALRSVIRAFRDESILNAARQAARELREEGGE